MQDCSKSDEVAKTAEGEPDFSPGLIAMQESD